ncbi:MAG: alpha/beta hydrolase [Proteobacteria bacterium]|nr:alpha/beta hydrolase [Pseudomonadota bacterium]
MTETPVVLDLGERQLGYRADGAGPLVVLIASTGRCGAEMAPLAAGLMQQGFRVLRPEPRGIAPSVGPMEGVTFHELADDLADIIRAEGGRAIVAGHAYGAWIARCLAQDHADLVSGVVFLAAGAKAWPAELSRAITEINDPMTPEADRLAALKLAFFAEGNDPAEWLAGWHPAVVEMQRKARAATRPEDWRPAGTAPILDLRGAQDPFRPAGTEAEIAEELGPRVTAMAIEGASHAMPVERPAEAAAAMGDWARRIGLLQAPIGRKPGKASIRAHQPRIEG